MEVKRKMLGKMWMPLAMNAVAIVAMLTQTGWLVGLAATGYFVTLGVTFHKLRG